MTCARTWRRGSGLVAFTMNVPSAGQPVATMARWAVALLKHVRLVGSISSVSLSTHTEEDAQTWTSDQIVESDIIDRIQSCDDLASVTCTCDLSFTTLDGTRSDIPSGLMAYVEFANRDKPDPDAPLESTIILDTDIYAAVSWGEDRDNRDLSRLNAPTFNRFLEEFANELSGDAFGVDGPDYSGQVNVRGFVIPV